MRIEWKPRAIRHIRALRRYIAENSPAAAERVAIEIRTAVHRLVEHPHIGRPGRIEGTRELVVPRTPYIVAYAIDGETIAIAAVIHGAQRWPADLAD